MLDAPVSLQEPVFAGIEPQFRPVAEFLAREGHTLPEPGNSLDIFLFGRPKFAALLQDLEQAQSTIDMEYYRFSADSIATEVRDMLIRKAAEGVVVRVILEAHSNSYAPSFYNRLKRAPGVSVVEVEPTNNWVGNLLVRDHRKLVVIDGKIGYSGGMNVQDRYHTIWRDTHVRVTGPVVRSYQSLFDSAWRMFGGSPAAGTVPAEAPVQTVGAQAPAGAPSVPAGVPVQAVVPPTAGAPVQAAAPVPAVGASAPAGAPSVPSADTAIMQLVGDGPDSKAHILRDGLEQALSHAQKYFYIQNPYFCPPESTLQALVDAAARGVDVQMMIPDTQDVIFMLWTNHHFYERLLRGGVRIFERSGTFMHSKTFVTDDYLSCIGSANIDNRSYNINYENNLYIYDREVALRCRAIYEKDMETSREITLADLRFPLWDLYMQKLMMLAAPQL